MTDKKRPTVKMADGRKVPVTVRPGTVDLDQANYHLRDGRPLTDARAEEITAKTIAKIRRAGRPSLTGQAVHSPQVAFRVTPEIRLRAERLAQKTGKSLSAIAREAFEDRLRKGA
jgi:hypothetical protein